MIDETKERKTRETLGQLLTDKEFRAYLVSFPVFFTISVIFLFSGYYKNLTEYCAWATLGLAAANYLGTISLGSCLFSWVLIDRISWLSRAIMFFISGALFFVCPLVLMLVMATNRESSIFESGHHFEEEHNASLSDESPANSKLHTSVFVQVLICLNLFQGLYCLIFFLCLCTVMDTTNF